MKKFTLVLCWITVVFGASLLINCKDENVEPTSIRVQSVKIDESLKQGITVQAGSDAINIADKVTILPENAANKRMIFSSSNKKIATVDEEGLVTAHDAGTATITVIVDGQTDQFTLTVDPKPPVLTNEIAISDPDVELQEGASVDIAGRITVLPADAANKTVSFSSADPNVATVNQSGTITAVSQGTTTISITSVQVPEVTGTINVTVTETDHIGDYDRTGWTVSASQNPLPSISEGNQLEHAIDGNENSRLALVRPSKSSFGVSVPSKENGGFISFTIDMQKQQKVNYFRIRHVPGLNQLRYYIIENISGSNDGENWTTIASDVEVTDAPDGSVVESPNIAIPSSNYRYIRFWCQKDECWKSMSQGATAQLTEIYLGNQ